MQWLGNYKEDDTLHFLWSSNAANGASITRATNGEVRVYKDNGVSQTTTGVTDTEDFDGLTGVHACTIDLSADVFYAVGADYSVVLQGATIDGQTVNAVLAHFSIENRFQEVDVVKLLGTAWLTPGVAGTPDVNAKLLGGTAQTGNDVGGDVNDILTDTGTTLDALIKDVPTTAEFEARSILAANYVVVGDTITGVTAVTNDVGITQAGADKVWGTAARALTDKAGFTLSAAGITAIWEKNISAFSGAGYAGTYVKTLYDDWINGGRLDNLLDAVYTGTPPTVNAIADQVWDEVLTGAVHNIATSAGRRLRQAADVMIIREETCQAGGGDDEIILDVGASATNEFYINDLIVLTSGTGVGQQRHIDSYVGSSKTATVNRDWTTNPDATTGFVIKADSTKHVHGFETAAKAEIESEANDALVAIKLDHLIAVSDGDDPVNNSLIAMLAATDGDWSNFAKATDSLQSIRDVAPHGSAMVGTNSASLAATALSTATWTAAKAALLDADISSRSSHTAANVRDAILSDSTPFNGADIAAILLDTGTTLETHLTEIKGTGFIMDTHSLVQCAAAVVGGGTLANQTTIINHLTGIKGATWSDETLVAIRNAAKKVFIKAGKI